MGFPYFCTKAVWRLRQARAAATGLCPLALGFLVAVAVVGCSSLPTRPIEPPVAPMADYNQTRLGRALAPMLAEHPQHSGAHLLSEGMDAFVARLALASVAEKTLDVQYYIWHPDDAGQLLANALIEAADRGVHVRLLLDDVGTAPSDVHLLALETHPNIEVRLFNPIVHRGFRKLGMLLDFGRVNRRMHNKSFTIDRQVTIVGGRNIGDEYFGIGEGVEFADLDVLAVGPVVKETATAFDLYWRSPSSIPIEAMNQTRTTPEWRVEQRTKLANRCGILRDSAYMRAARASDLANQLRANQVPFAWGRAWLAYDLPDKISTSQDDRSTHLIPQLQPLIDGTQSEVVIVSPYFVPGRKGVKFFQSLRRRGVRVVIITNSLEATDVAAVHAGYRRCRKELLRAGVEVREFRALAPAQGEGKKAASGGGSSLGSSRMSLHAKTFVFDQRAIFVGSLNLDPRSATLNTEVGAVFDVPNLAAELARGIEKAAARRSYRLEWIPGPGSCKECGTVNWVLEEDGRVERHTREPNASFGRRCLVELLSLLPIESQL